MHNATLASGTAVSPAKVGQNESSTASPPPLNVSSFLNTSDPQTFPRAFTEGTISGDYPAQHISGLVRWPLLLKYGGVYADVGLIQIGDLDRLWRGKVGNPFSPPFDVLVYDAGGICPFGLIIILFCVWPEIRSLRGVIGFSCIRMGARQVRRG